MRFVLAHHLLEEFWPVIVSGIGPLLLYLRVQLRRWLDRSPTDEPSAVLPPEFHAD